MMRFIPEWERPPEPNPTDNFRGWIDWSLTYKAHASDDLKQAILAIVDRLPVPQKEDA
jgi:hypothetical protein